MIGSNLDYNSLHFTISSMLKDRYSFIKSSILKCRHGMIITTYGPFAVMIKVGKNERVIVSGICGESSSRCLLVPSLQVVL